MTTKFEYRGFEFELLDGEFRRYRDFPELANREEYLTVAKYNGNRILLQHVRTDGKIVDYIRTLFENIPDFAFDYLMSVLNSHQNIMSCVSYVAIEDAMTSFTIYYGCDCDSDQIDDIIAWMISNNDWAAENYRYTEVVEGHQKCVGT